MILGSGVNQDGHTNGITVPNPDAQVSLIRRVCAEAGIAPGDLQYMEAHGTSTPSATRSRREPWPAPWPSDASRGPARTSDP